MFGAKQRCKVTKMASTAPGGKALLLSHSHSLSPVGISSAQAQETHGHSTSTARAAIGDCLLISIKG